MCPSSATSTGRLDPNRIMGIATGRGDSEQLFAREGLHAIVDPIILALLGPALGTRSRPERNVPHLPHPTPTAIFKDIARTIFIQCHPYDAEHQTTKGQHAADYLEDS